MEDFTTYKHSVLTAAADALLKHIQGDISYTQGAVVSLLSVLSALGLSGDFDALLRRVEALESRVNSADQGRSQQPIRTRGM